MEGTIGGTGNAGSFSVDEDGHASGHTLTGSVTVGRGRVERGFAAGHMWASAGRSGIRRVLAQPAQTTPAADVQVADLEEGGPVAAAQNGLPVSLGDALAAAGASSDIVAAARNVEAANGNPQLESYPVGDLALLVSLAGDLQGAYGGSPFPAAHADIIRTYLGFLAEGGSGANFLTAYAGFLTQYLDLIRTGGLPSNFDAAGLADINAFLTYQGNLGALASLSAQDQALAQAYLSFLQTGGKGDLFAGQFTTLIEAYFAFVRGGGNPLEFTGASQDVVDAYIAFVSQSGLSGQLSADNQALIQAYLASGGFNFAAQYASALEAYFAFLQQGNLPSQYGALNGAAIQAYLEALQASGLFEQLLGQQADFYADYLTFLQTGGDPDLFAGLPNADLVPFADALNAYADFLAGGGLPSDYDADALVTLTAYLRAISNAGQSSALLGDNSALLSAYFAYLTTGANADLFAGLPIYADYTAALQAYYYFLIGGGLPADYTAISQQQIADYLAALSSAGGFAGQLGDLSDFYTAYFAYLSTGGDPALFAGLPIYADYLAAISQFYAFLAGGGLPSEYTALTAQQVEDYLQSLADLGLLAGNFQGDLLTFLTDYLAFLAGGGLGDDFGGLPGSGGGISIPDAGYAYAGGFTATTGINGYVTSPVNGGGLVSNLSGTVNGNGDPSGFAFQPTGEAAANVGGNAAGVVGQFANANLHYVLMAPIVGSLPTSGTVDYQIVAATAPTYSDGHTDAGTFAANLSFGFGPTLQYAIDGTITMPDATYSFASPGGASGQLTNPNNGAQANFISLRPALSATGPSCAAGNCFLNMFGGFGGSNLGENIGFSYHTVDPSRSNEPFVQGSVLFGANGDVGGGDGGGDDGGSGSGGTITLDYAGNFTSVPANTTYIGHASGSVRTESLIDTGRSNSSYTIDNSGALTFYGSASAWRIGTAEAVEISGNEDVLIGRWTDGRITFGTSTAVYDLSPNQSFHYLLANPVADSFVFPDGVRVDYQVGSTTSPTIGNGSRVPGVFDANLALIFGRDSFAQASISVGIEGTLTLPGAGSELIWTFANTGGLANTAGYIEASVLEEFFRFRAPATVNNTSCTSNCTVEFFNYLTGENGTDVVGSTYRTLGSDADNAVTGAVIWVDDRISVEVGGGTTSGFTGTRDSIVYYTYTNGSLASGFGGSASLVNGELTGFTSILGAISNGTTSIVEAGDLGDLAWARWTGGNVTDNGLLGNNTIPVSATGGYHVMAGSASTSLPASGRVDYSLVATTAATDNQGSAPGTITGDLAIQFGATSLVGYELAMEVGGRGYAVATTGGVANPGASQINVVLGSGGPTFGGSFNSIIAGSVTGSGGACVSSCQVSVSGALYGANGAHAGVAMNVIDAGSGIAVQASGLAIFSAGAGASGNASGGGATTLASVAPADWDRWNVPSDTITMGTDMAMMAPGLDALASRGIQFSPEQLTQLEAFYAARNSVN